MKTGTMLSAAILLAINAHAGQYDKARILRYHEFAFEIQQRLNEGIKI